MPVLHLNFFFNIKEEKDTNKNSKIDDYTRTMKIGKIKQKVLEDNIKDIRTLDVNTKGEKETNKNSNALEEVKRMVLQNLYRIRAINTRMEIDRNTFENKLDDVLKIVSAADGLGKRIPKTMPSQLYKGNFKFYDL